MAHKRRFICKHCNEKYDGAYAIARHFAGHPTHRTEAQQEAFECNQRLLVAKRKRQFVKKRKGVYDEYRAGPNAIAGAQTAVQVLPNLPTVVSGLPTEFIDLGVTTTPKRTRTNSKSSNRFCTACGMSRKTEHRFCGGCGERL
jgi:hypothetical protein